jgi:hypothetical protein
VKSGHEHIAGQILDLKHRTHAFTAAFRIQGFTSVAGAIEVGIAGKREVATGLTNESPIQMTHHRPEFEPDSAVRATDYFIHHGESLTRVLQEVIA